ncbi:MAG: NAD-dependent epimerase/dehydratase family protein [Minisyncoccia bacterium]
MKNGQKTALVLGGGGFIGHHMIKRLKAEGFWVRGVDLKNPEYEATIADDFIVSDLSLYFGMNQILMAPDGSTFDHIYQFAADMGGAGYVFVGINDAAIMHNSVSINLNVLKVQHNINQVFGINKTKIFYSSSACMYPEYNQQKPGNPNCKEDSAYPAQPDSEYGWEKLFSEHLYLAYCRNYGIPVRIARYHNIFGPLGTWDGGREKSPAAMCRKVAQSVNGEIVIWGDGKQTRSFLYIDECIEATRRLMESDFGEPVNIGSEEMITINGLVHMVADIAGKDIKINHDLENTALGVRGRNSDNTLYRGKIGWAVSAPLCDGLAKTYEWISEQIKNTAK